MAEEHDQHGGGGEDHEGKGHGGGHGHGGGGHGHGGGGEHEEAGAPEWLISFADNVALLMGFFVILLAMNMAKPTTGGIGGEDKMPASEDAVADMVLSIRAGFNQAVSLDSSDPKEAWLRKRMLERQQQGETTQPGPEGKDKSPQAVRPSDFVNIAGYVTFLDGASSLTPDAREVLKRVADQLRGTRWIVEVRGHVSAMEADNDKDAAMKLAYERAMSTSRALVVEGVRWESLRVVACADNARATPVARESDEHRNNQRAEIVVTQETLPSDPYTQAAPGE
jgi:chemotaxis protein MotB